MLVLAASVTALAAVRARAQDEYVRSLVAHVDFESELTTGQTIPRGWVKTELPGVTLGPGVLFPKHYLEGRLIGQSPYEGQTCFEMALNGGNIAYTFQPGVPAFSDSDYLVTGWVRTMGLQAARAQARIFLVDALGQVIPGSMSAGEPMGRPGSPADGQWHSFQIRLRAAFPEAARLQVTLSLVQPNVWQDPAERHVYRQDITGSACWDDIRIYRLPRVRIHTDAPGNVFAPGANPRLRISVQGVEQVDSGVMLTIRDAAGVIRRQQVVTGDGPEWQGKQWSLSLESLEPGWYEAELTVSTSDQAMTRRTCRFVCLAEAPSVRRSGLGVYLADRSAPEIPTALTLAAQTRFSTVKLSAWLSQPELRVEPAAAAATPNAPPDQAPIPASRPATGDADSLLTLLTRAHELGLAPELVLDDVPTELLEHDRADPQSTLSEALAEPSAALEEAVLLMLARYGWRVSAWQIGRPLDEHIPWDEQTPAAYETMCRWMRRVLNRQQAMLSWNGDFEYRLSGPARLSVAISAASPPREAPDILSPFMDKLGDVFLAVAPADTERRSRLSDLALRYAYARAAGVRRIYLDPPWRTLEDGTAEPEELLLAVRTLASWLGEAQCIGTARLDDSTVAIIFRKDAEGRMLIHRTGAAGEPLVRLALPAGAYTVDLWGRRGSPSARDAAGIILPGDGMPFIIAGCEADALALRASLRIAPELLDSRFDNHPLELSFVNPYDQPVTGTVRLTAPEGWNVRPRVLHFSLRPGQPWSAPVSVSFPYRETIGLKQMDVRVEVQARHGQSIEAPAYFYLALRNVDFDVFHSLEPQGDLEVRTSIVNRSEAPISYECYVQVPDRARQSSLIYGLAPGARAEKVFRFPRGTELSGQTLRTGLVESGGRGVANRTEVIR